MKIGDKVYVVVARDLKPARVTSVQATYFVCELSGPITGVTTHFGVYINESKDWCRADDQVIADAMRVALGWR